MLTISKRQPNIRSLLPVITLSSITRRLEPAVCRTISVSHYASVWISDG
jgi:hypothetical protein